MKDQAEELAADLGDDLFVNPIANLGRLWFRCPICKRLGGRGIVWHGTTSNLQPAMVHKHCGLAASAEFSRGFELAAAPTPQSPPEQ